MQVWWAKAEELAVEAVKLKISRKMWELCLGEATASAHREADRDHDLADKNSIKRRAQRQFVEKMLFLS